jgi:hypothetical protein
MVALVPMGGRDNDLATASSPGRAAVGSSRGRGERAKGRVGSEPPSVALVANGDDQTGNGGGPPSMSIDVLIFSL